MWILGKERTISFRADPKKIDKLDTLAATQDRPRSYLINEAINNYIELHAYQDDLVRAGLGIREGRTLTHEEVERRLRWSQTTRDLQDVAKRDNDFQGGDFLD